MSTSIPTPIQGEYNSYFETYIKLVEDINFYVQLKDNSQQISVYFTPLNSDDVNYAYADGKWTRKEVLQHIIDVERVMLNRAFVASKLDDFTNLTAMKDMQYVANSNCNNRTISSMLEELHVVRQLTEITFQSLNDVQWKFKANNNGHPITASALAYIILGHAKHHLSILKDRY